MESKTFFCLPLSLNIEPEDQRLSIDILAIVYLPNQAKQNPHKPYSLMLPDKKHRLNFAGSFSEAIEIRDRSRGFNFSPRNGLFQDSWKMAEIANDLNLSKSIKEIILC